MRLIFNNEIEFLKKELGIEIPSETAWMNSMRIRVCDENSKWHTLYQIRANNMKLELVKDNSEKVLNKKLLKWNDLISKYKDDLLKLESDSIEVINKYIKLHNEKDIIVPISGGKDSAIVSYLVNKVADRKVTHLFSNTTNETHHTYKYVKSNYDNLEIINPKEGFYPWVIKTGFVPNRVGRACCSIFKENQMISKLKDRDNLLIFMGMRKDESTNRSHYKTEWRNERWTNTTWQGILPILEWQEFYIWLYMLYREIPVGDVYSFGYNRLGCTNCPYRSDYELILNKEFLPTYHSRWQEILKSDFINNQKWINVNCTLQEYLDGAWKGTLYRSEPSQEVINEFAEYNNLNEKVAENYFNHYCSDCDKEYEIGKRNKRKRVKDKEVLAMNMKFLGRNIKYFRCKKCLMKMLEITQEEWNNYVKTFKENGCNLF